MVAYLASPLSSATRSGSPPAAIANAIAAVLLAAPASPGTVVAPPGSPPTPPWSASGL